MNPLSNFPRNGKIISVILIIVIGYFIYIEWSISPYNRTNDLKPGSKEYDFIHANDTIDESRGEIKTASNDTIYIPGPMWIEITDSTIQLGVSRPKSTFSED